MTGAVIARPARANPKPCNPSFCLIALSLFLWYIQWVDYSTHKVESASSRPASKDLHYQSDGYLYMDTYLGGIDFAGEEAVWTVEETSQTPIWSMNYYGRMLVEEIPEGFSHCLKSALLAVPREAPFRGPAEFEDGRLAYHCQWNGDLYHFQGAEQILFEGVKVYELLFHGGQIM